MDKKFIDHGVEELRVGDSEPDFSRQISPYHSSVTTPPDQATQSGSKRDSLDITSASDTSSREKQGPKEHQDGGITPSHTTRQPRPLSVMIKQNLDRIQHMPVIGHVINWMKGPSPPQSYQIVPFLPGVQSWPTTLLLPYFTQKSGTTIVASLVCIIWLVVFSTVLATAKKTTINIGGTQAPVRLSCITTLWDDSCGLDRRFCQPLKGSPFAFTCPAGCASVNILNPYTVGGQEINYRDLVIGGSLTSNQSASIYRGDSFICQAAVHAGVISDAYGGSAILNREGEHADFSSVARNGITSIGFQPSFPLSFSLSSSSENYEDPRWYVFIVSVFATVIISVIATPPALFFSSIFVIVFFQVALASDPPWSSEYSGVVSLAFERFLPAAFVAIAIFRFCVHRTMKNMKAYWERTVLWMGGCWVGALNAYTFDRIPVSRLFGHDIRQQPGAVVALIVIVLVLFVIVVGQVWVFRKEGRLLLYLKCYVLFGIILACLAGIPDLDIRLHHYIIALILLPGTSIQTRPTLLYQGILVGLFINGIARWGFASILQQTSQLLTGALSGSAKPTVVTPNIANDTINFTIQQIADGFDGVSIRVNDVELFQLTNATVPVLFNWTRTAADQNSYFRFAFTGTYTTGGIWYGDYTRPGTWLANGTWRDVLPGP